MIEMTDEETKVAVNQIRKLLEQAAPSAADAMMVCLVAAGSYSMQLAKHCAERAAKTMDVASKSIVRSVRRGGLEVRRLDS